MPLLSSLLKDVPNHQELYRTSQLILLPQLTVSPQTGELLLWVVHTEVSHGRVHMVSIKQMQLNKLRVQRHVYNHGEHCEGCLRARVRVVWALLRPWWYKCGGGVKIWHLRGVFRGAAKLSYMHYDVISCYVVASQTETYVSHHPAQSITGDPH